MAIDAVARTASLGAVVLVPWWPPNYDCSMTEAIAFDTHRFVKRLIDGGFTVEQAETLAEEHVALLNANLATKTDIAEIKREIEALRQETKSEVTRVEAGIEALRQETRANIEAVKAGLLKWMFTIVMVQGGLVVTLIKLL